MTNETSSETNTVFFEYVELLDWSISGDCVNYVAFRIEEIIFNRITENNDINISWYEFMTRIRDTDKLTSMINNIVEKSLDNVTVDQFDFNRTEQRIAWFDKTSHDFEAFVKLPENKRGIGLLHKVMYWAERTFYDRIGGVEEKRMWQKFCRKIMLNRTLYYRIHRGVLHYLVEIDFEKYIPDTNTLLAQFI